MYDLNAICSKVVNTQIVGVTYKVQFIGGYEHVQFMTMSKLLQHITGVQIIAKDSYYVYAECQRYADFYVTSLYFEFDTDNKHQRYSIGTLKNTTGLNIRRFKYMLNKWLKTGETLSLTDMSVPESNNTATKHKHLRYITL